MDNVINSGYNFKYLLNEYIKNNNENSEKSENNIYGLFGWLIFFITMMVSIHYIILINTRDLVDNWENKRCDPTILPFAGLINAPKGTSKIKYTSDNFEDCVKKYMNGSVTNNRVLFDNKVSDISTNFTDLSNNFKNIKNDVKEFQSRAGDNFENIYKKINHFTKSISENIFRSKDVIKKTNVLLSATVNNMRNGVITSESILLEIYNKLVTIAWTINGLILNCIIMSCVYPPTIGAGVTASMFLSSLLVPIMSFISIFDSYKNNIEYNKPPYEIPAVRKCFDGNTKIKTKHDGDVMIKNLSIGQELHDGSIVTALTISSSKNLTLFKIGNVIVTGCHKILNLNNKWVDVYDYDDSNITMIEDYIEPYVYCIGTNSKRIKINELIFLDWDEVDDEMTTLLCREKNICNLDIHKYFDVGIHPDTLIELIDKTFVEIKNIKVNDVLACGSLVETVVKIKTDDIHEFCEVFYDDKFILSATKNTEIVVEEKHKLILNKINPPDFCYHLITDTGGFNVCNLILTDYNKGIDRYLIK
jgi:hypothetical protein